jgi:tRNA nucleotidyltransferase/poly(A) polymerase
LRRDFTINAMAISLNKADYGELIDPLTAGLILKRKSYVHPVIPT